MVDEGGFCVSEFKILHIRSYSFRNISQELENGKNVE